MTAETIAKGVAQFRELRDFILLGKRGIERSDVGKGGRLAFATYHLLATYSGTV